MLARAIAVTGTLFVGISFAAAEEATPTSSAAPPSDGSCIFHPAGAPNTSIKLANGETRVDKPNKAVSKKGQLDALLFRCKDGEIVEVNQ